MSNSASTTPLSSPPENTTAGDLLYLLGHEGKVLALGPEDSLQRASDVFHEHGISQLPVVEGERVVGAIQEITMVYALHRGHDPQSVRLRDVMARPMPQLDATVLLEEVYRLLLAGNTAVVITRQDRLIGLITRSDMMDYYERDRRLKRVFNGTP